MYERCEITSFRKNLPLNSAPHVFDIFFYYFIMKISISLYLDCTINNVKTAL